MELQQLIYFKTAAECENLTEAARRLYISQPALSQTIQRLEQDLGAPLFDRQGRSIHLNDAGRIALTYTDLVLKDISTMRSLIQNQTSAEDGIRLMTDLPNITRYLIPRYQQEKEPEVLHAQYVEELRDGKDLLLNRLCDIVITNHGETCPDLESYPLLRDLFVVQLPESHPYAQRSSLTYQDLSALMIIDAGSSHNTKSVRLVREVLQKYNKNLHYVPTMDTGSQGYLLETTDSCIVSSAMTAMFWKIPRHRGIPLRGSDAAIEYHITFRADASPSCRQFVRWLQSWALWATQMWQSEYL